MMRLRPWFDTRSLREKRLIAAMLALAVLTAIWAGIIRPVGDALSSARERHADAVVRLANTQAALDTLRGIQARRSRPLTGSLVDTVRAAASEAGFVLANLDQQAPDRVHVGIQSARAGALVGWLARLERSGVLVDNARLTDNGDRTVGVDLTLKERGR
jgi:general secretion pathway protein M